MVAIDLFINFVNKMLMAECVRGTEGYKAYLK